MRREYVFILALILLAGLLFGIGSPAAIAVRNALRGPLPTTNELTASVMSAFSGLQASGTASVGGRTVPVYSQYPLNLKQEIVIAAGSADGITLGDVALADGFFVGLITKVAERSATVQTIFDSRFQAPVRIGAAGTDALLKGGSNPTLALIPADASAGEGEQVYSAVAGIPYGTPLGVLRGLRDAADKVFREASLAAPYNPGALDIVTIIPSSRP